jgi:hypothetical protein
MTNLTLAFNLLLAASEADMRMPEDPEPPARHRLVEGINAFGIDCFHPCP